MWSWLRRLGQKTRQDATPLARVTERVMRNGNPEDRGVSVPLLTLDEFFCGNSEIGSIGCNLPGEPTPGDFHTLLARILEKDEVSDIRMQITCLDDPGVMWPFSDTVWIMTSATEAEVASWFPDELAPDDCWEGWQQSVKYEPVSIQTGHHPIACWYD